MQGVTNKKCYEFARRASGEQESETLMPHKKNRKGKSASYTSTFRNPLNNVWTQSMDQLGCLCKQVGSGEWQRSQCSVVTCSKLYLYMKISHP